MELTISFHDISDDWATGHGINKALTNVLGPLAHVVHPDTCSISSPLDPDYDKVSEQTT